MRLQLCRPLAPLPPQLRRYRRAFHAVRAFERRAAESVVRMRALRVAVRTERNRLIVRRFLSDPVVSRVCRFAPAFDAARAARVLPHELPVGRVSHRAVPLPRWGLADRLAEDLAGEPSA